MVTPGVNVVVQEGCVSCSMMSLGAGADLGSPEGVVHPKDRLEGKVLRLAPCSRRLSPHHIATGLVGPACACALCRARSAVDSVHGVQPVRVMGVRGAMGCRRYLTGMCHVITLGAPPRSGWGFF